MFRNAVIAGGLRLLPRAQEEVELTRFCFPNKPRSHQGDGYRLPCSDAHRPAVTPSDPALLLTATRTPPRGPWTHREVDTQNTLHLLRPVREFCM